MLAVCRRERFCPQKQAIYPCYGAVSQANHAILTPKSFINRVIGLLSDKLLGANMGPAAL
jgi:hypothetical protein